MIAKFLSRLGWKKEKNLADHIEEQLRCFDYFPQLEIVKVDLNYGRRIYLSDGRHSCPKNPTKYVLNSRAESSEWYSDEVMATMVAMRWIRRRAQSGDDKPQPFPYIIDPGIFKWMDSLLFNSWDEYEADAEVVARIAAAMKSSGRFSNKEIAEIARMPAEEILKKVGLGIFQSPFFNK
ncbi:MAG: hypothetical protein WC554_11420 [Clostridia bacterium]|jgi:hypothetical protein